MCVEMSASRYWHYAHVRLCSNCTSKVITFKQLVDVVFVVVDPGEVVEDAEAVAEAILRDDDLHLGAVLLLDPVHQAADGERHHLQPARAAAKEDGTY